MMLRLVYAVMHYMFYLRTFLWDWMLTFGKTFSPYMHKITYNRTQTDSKNLKKLPLHIGILVAEEDVSIADLANIVLWCMAVGVSYISIYDKNGVCKQRKEELDTTIRQQENTLSSGESSKKISFSLHSGLNPVHQEKGSLGASVVLLDRSDGCNEIVSVARRMAASVANKHMSLSDITPNSVDEKLKGGASWFPDPDLVLRFGSTASMLGYLPWQIRLTEILSISSHHRLDYYTLHKALASYADTHQRFGK